jgi:hypothetical protein
VHRAGQGLYGHSRLVGHVPRDLVELGRMSNEGLLRPSPARIATEAGLYARGYVTLDDVQAQSVPTGGAVGARGVYTTHHAAKGRLHYDPLSGGEAGVVLCYDAEDLVAHDEGRRGYRGEVRRAFRR